MQDLTGYGKTTGYVVVRGEARSGVEIRRGRYGLICVFRR